MGPLGELLERPFQVVAGKGGVGRTSVATALALRSARAGKRTLLLEVNAPDSVAQLLGVPPVVSSPKEVQRNLWICRMTPADSLREYALMILKFKALYGLVFENRLVKFLLRAIPSLGEFTMLGKTWFHAIEKRPDGSLRFERIIVDAPATGHAITFLSVARTVADVVPKGIMQTAAERMAGLVESQTASCLHVVALPEEMPVNEGLDLIAAAKQELGMALGAAILNRRLSPLLGPEERAAFERLEQRAEREPELKPWISAARLRLDREAWQASYARRYAEASAMAWLELPDLGARVVDAQWLEQLIAAIDRTVAAEGK